MLFMVVPSQIVFVLIIQVLQAGHTSITPQFVAVYLLMSLIQVIFMFYHIFIQIKVQYIDLPLKYRLAKWLIFGLLLCSSY